MAICILYFVRNCSYVTFLYTFCQIFFPDKELSLVIFSQYSKNRQKIRLGYCYCPTPFRGCIFRGAKKNRLLESISNAIPEAEIHKRNLIAFPDEKGEIKISVMLENLLYVESSDNYATIHYLNKAKLSHYLIRNSLKWMEENLTKETPLVRCHRSFIVNLDKVKVLRKTKDGIFLEMDALNTPDIQVSKTYYERVMDKFSKYSI